MILCLNVFSHIACSDMFQCKLFRLLFKGKFREILIITHKQHVCFPALLSVASRFTQVNGLTDLNPALFWRLGSAVTVTHSSSKGVVVSLPDSHAPPLQCSYICRGSRNGGRQNGTLLPKARAHTGVIPCNILYTHLLLPIAFQNIFLRTLSPSHPRVYGRYTSYDELRARAGTRWVFLLSQTLTIRRLSGGLFSVFLWSQESRYGKGLIRRLLSGNWSLFLLFLLFWRMSIWLNELRMICIQAVVNYGACSTLAAPSSSRRL